MSLSTGDVIEGKYRIIRMIGEGGMGAVYEGENVRIHRKVAIKVLHAGVAENADAVQRFEREAQAAGRIGSEHIVEVLDLGNLPSGDRFMVMEFLEGEPFSDRIHNKGRLTPEELVPIARQILEGLDGAHTAGIIHRDLKPDNVFILKSRASQIDFVKLVDFGISKFSALSGESGFSMTRTGAVMGTPYYMSPEQAKGAKNMDQRADLYAVGVILYEAITGTVPFNADTFNELLFKIVLETPPPIEQIVPDIDPNFRNLVNKSMAREPDNRYQTAKEFQKALDDWASGAGVPVFNQLGGTPQPGATPGPGARTPGGQATPGAWSNADGGGAGGAAEKKKAPVALIAAAAAVLLVGGVAATQLGGGEAPPPPAAGPSMEEIRAAAAEEAQKATEAAKQEAAQELKQAKEEVRQAEAQAKEAAEELRRKAEEEAARQKEEEAKREEAARRAAAARAVAPKVAPKAAPAPQPAPRSGGRTIRTEL